MEIKRLTPQFYQDNAHLKEALDINNNNIKNRGYGIVLVQLRGLIFGIPLRSNIRHKSAFITKQYQFQKKGLDYTKALLIEDKEYIAGTFEISSQELNKIRKKKSLLSNNSLNILSAM